MEIWISKKGHFPGGNLRFSGIKGFLVAEMFQGLLSKINIMIEKHTMKSQKSMDMRVPKSL